MNILGLSGLAHDPSAALLCEGEIEAAIEESKLVRERRVAGIPREAIQFCQEKAGVDWKEIDYVAIASRPFRAWFRESWLRGRLTLQAPVASTYYQTKALGELGRELNNYRIIKAGSGKPRQQVLSLDHHLCHAASAFYASAFDRALILVLDERGDGDSGLVALGEGLHIRPLRSISFPHSLAWVYSQVTELLGFTPHQDEHKTQWLSLEGEPSFAGMFVEMLRGVASPVPRLDRRYFNRGLKGRVVFSRRFYRQLRLPADGHAELLGSLRQELASSLQLACLEVVREWTESLRRETHLEHLCLAGGLFLNALLVAELEKSTGFREIFVQPAAGNPGCSAGAAWLVWHAVLGRDRAAPITHVYWGPSYTRQEIKEVLDNCKALYRWCDTEEQKIENAIRLLHAGKIVAWHQGATEFGPRALGNRSLLASPWAPYVRENLNDYVKHREPFRPFAVAVPVEDASKYFEFSPAARFMSSLGRVRPDTRSLFEGFLLPGDRIRLHVVERTANPLFWHLLKRFGKSALAPCLVNTSFNLFGEPLVTRPRDAIRSYFCSGIDALAIGNFALWKM